MAHLVSPIDDFSGFVIFVRGAPKVEKDLSPAKVTCPSLAHSNSSSRKLYSQRSSGTETVQQFVPLNLYLCYRNQYIVLFIRRLTWTEPNLVIHRCLLQECLTRCNSHHDREPTPKYYYSKEPKQFSPSTSPKKINNSMLTTVQR